MANKRIVKSVQIYMDALTKNGIPVRYGVLFGSHVNGKPHKWSDIDLLVVSPLYDKRRTHKQAAKLWRIAADIDARIEPIPVGEKQFKQDNNSVIIVVARREGQIIPLVE